MHPPALDPLDTTDMGEDPSGPSLRRTLRMPGDALGDWIVQETIGMGSMAVVYACRHPATGRRAAIKLLHPRGYTDAAIEAQDRWLQHEARALARLSHRGIVQVHGLGEIDGVRFMVMELVDGVTLATWLGQRRRSWAQVARVMRDVAVAVAAAHAAGVVHGDIKPDNIMVTRAGEVRVMDFGLAEAMGPPLLPPDLDEPTEDLDPTRTRRMSSAPRGTPAYMAPERLSGQPGTPITDQFSLCVTFYEALYGARPYDGRTPAQLYFRATRPLLRVTPNSMRVPAWLHAIVTRGLGSPERRWPSLEQMVAAIDRGMTQHHTRRASWIGAAVAIVIAGLVAVPSFAASRCSHDGFADRWSSRDAVQLHATLLARGVDPPVARDTVLALDHQVQAYRREHDRSCHALRSRQRERACLHAVDDAMRSAHAALLDPARPTDPFVPPAVPDPGSCRDR